MRTVRDGAWRLVHLLVRLFEVRPVIHLQADAVRPFHDDEATISASVEPMVWSKEHAPHPGILSRLVAPSDDSRLTREQLDYSAKTILTSLTTGQQ